MEYALKDVTTVRITKSTHKDLLKVMGRKTEVIGIRLSSKEMFKSGASNSPFLILIEPLLTDDSDTKFLVQITFSTNSHESALDFSSNLYKRLKALIGEINV